MATPTDRRTRQPKEIAHLRARHAAISRARLPGDPDVIAAHRELQAAQQRHAARSFLDAVEARQNNDSDGVIEALSGGPVALAALEGVELLAYVVRLSDRPDEMLSALRHLSTH